MSALIVDPALQAEVIRQFNLRGELAPFRLTEEVVPIFDIGRLLSLAVPTVVTTLEGSQGVRIGTTGGTDYLPVGPVQIDDGDVTNSGAVVNPGAAAVLVDPGAVVGSSIRHVEGVINWNTAEIDFQVEWRNAANTATLTLWSYFCGAGNASVKFGPWFLNIASGERIRVVTAGGGVGTADVTIVINGVAASDAD